MTKSKQIRKKPDVKSKVKPKKVVNRIKSKSILSGKTRLDWTKYVIAVATIIATLYLIGFFPWICNIKKNLFPWKFDDTKTFNVLILQFDRKQIIEGQIIKIEDEIKERLEHINQLHNMNMKIEIDDIDIIISDFNNAKKQGNDRGADFVIFGNLYHDGEGVESSIKYLYIRDEDFIPTLIMEDRQVIILSSDENDNLYSTLIYETEPIRMPNISAISTGILKGNIEAVIATIKFFKEYYSKDYKNAYKTSISIIPSNPDKRLALYSFQIECLINLKDDKNIVNIYSKIINDTALNYKKSSAYLNRGVSNRRLGNIDQAFSDYNDCIRIDNKYGLAYLNRGNLYLEKDEFKLAIDDYNKAIEIDSTHAKAYSKRGAAKTYLKEYTEAEKDFNKAIELGYISTELYNDRGIMYKRLHNFEDAIKSFTKATEIDKNYNVAYFNRSQVNITKKDYIKAISDLSEAINIDSSYHQAFFWRAYCFSKIKEYENAIKDINKALELDSTNENGFINRGYYYLSNGNYNLAIEDFTKALKMNNKNPYAYNNRALAYAYIGNLDNALHDIKESEKLYPKNPYLFKHKGLIYEKMGKNKIALKLLQEAAELDNEIKEDTKKVIEDLKRKINQSSK